MGMRANQNQPGIITDEYARYLLGIPEDMPGKIVEYTPPKSVDAPPPEED